MVCIPLFLGWLGRAWQDTNSCLHEKCLYIDFVVDFFHATVTVATPPGCRLQYSGLAVVMGGTKVMMQVYNGSADACCSVLQLVH